MELEVVPQRELQASRRDAIVRLLDRIVSGGLDLGPESCPVEHHFAPGQYGRVIHMPAGMIVVGKIHKHAHVNVLSQGCVQVFTEQEGMIELRAPITFVSSPGTQRVVLVIEDTVWTTVHCTDKTDLAEIEREVIATDYSEV